MAIVGGADVPKQWIVTGSSTGPTMRGGADINARGRLSHRLARERQVRGVGTRPKGEPTEPSIESLMISASSPTRGRTGTPLRARDFKTGWTYATSSKQHHIAIAPPAPRLLHCHSDPSSPRPNARFHPIQAWPSAAPGAMEPLEKAGAPGSPWDESIDDTIPPNL